jgi:nicotinamidase-related amidase
MKIPSELPIPDFYWPGNSAEWDYEPKPGELAARAARWRRFYGLRPAPSDPQRIELLLVDCQRDFCLPQGALYVAGRSGRGAIEDIDRIARFVYRNLAAISGITCTLDTHLPHQIFFPGFWRDAAGEPLRAHREITAEEVRSGAVTPDPALAGCLSGGDVGWLRRHAETYCAELERAGKYRLFLWPYHVLLGSSGHDLVGVVQEARLFHAFARAAADPLVRKGDQPLTENYSVFSPEVERSFDGRPLGEPHRELLDHLLAADALIVAGEAASHCVKSSVEDLLAEVAARDPALAGKIYLLADCMSAVTVADPAKPGELLFDFTPQAEAALARFAAAGVHVVRSTTPLAQWPGPLGGAA